MERPWISRPLSNRIQSPIVGLDEEETIDKLFNTGCHSWNCNLINELFIPEEARLIKEIPLGLVDRKDQIVWNYTHNGLHSIRSAYHLHKTTLNRDIGESFHGLGWQGT